MGLVFLPARTADVVDLLDDAGSMSRKFCAAGSPLMLADVETMAFWNLKQSSWENGSLVMRMPMEPS